MRSDIHVGGIDDEPAEDDGFQGYVARPLQHRLDAGQDFIDGEGFADIIVTASGESGQQVVLGIPCSQEDYGDIAEILFSNLVGQLEPGHSGEHDVQQDNVRNYPFAELDMRGFGRAAFYGIIACGRQIERKDLADISFVVDNHHFHTMQRYCFSG